MQEENMVSDFWPAKKLGEVADFLDNLRKPVTASDRVPGPYPYYGANGQQDSVNDYIFDDELVLLAEDGGYFGSKTRPVAYRVSGKCWVNNHAHVLKNKEGISDIDFLGYSLMYYDVTPYISGTTRAKLNKSEAMKIPLKVPPLTIQKQIVERMDKIAEAQKLNDELIRKADELYRSLLHNELNSKLKNQNVKLQFKIKKLGEIAEVTSSKRIYQSEYVKDGIPFYRTKEIVELSQNKSISLELFISEERFNEIKEKFSAPERGDILISAVGTIGISWVVSDDRKFYFKDGNLLWIKDLKGVNPSYLKIVLDNFTKNIAQMGAGAAYNALTIIKLKKFQILVPPIEIQKQIVEKLSAAQEYKTQLLARKSKLKELFDSVLDKSMNGEIDN